ncbi:MAG: hypothetical protein QM703_27175 [Gemmatales bacterium]
MEPKRFELECQVCGTTMMSSNPKEQCQVCGGEMIVAPFFSVQQTMTFGPKDNTARHTWIALLALLLIGMVATGVIVLTKEQKTPQGTKKAK